jgi:hypothetical protein
MMKKFLVGEHVKLTQDIKSYGQVFVTLYAEAGEDAVVVYDKDEGEFNYTIKMLRHFGPLLMVRENQLEAK